MAIFSKMAKLTFPQFFFSKTGFNLRPWFGMNGCQQVMGAFAHCLAFSKTVQLFSAEVPALNAAFQPPYNDGIERIFQEIGLKLKFSLRLFALRNVLGKDDNPTNRA